MVTRHGCGRKTVNGITASLNDVIYSSSVGTSDAIVAVGLVTREMIRNIRNSLGDRCARFAMIMLIEVINGTRHEWPKIDECAGTYDAMTYEPIN